MSKRLGYSEEELKNLAVYEETESFKPEIKAAIKLAENMTHNAHSVSDEDFAELREYYSEPEIIELASVIGLMNYFNRFTTSLRIDLSGTNAPYETFDGGGVGIKWEEK